MTHMYLLYIYLLKGNTLSSHLAAETLTGLHTKLQSAAFPRRPSTLSNTIFIAFGLFCSDCWSNITLFEFCYHRHVFKLCRLVVEGLDQSESLKPLRSIKQLHLIGQALCLVDSLKEV